ncbi:LamG-like jellyroll fold domain-containing protein [Bacteroidota bacterium]
MKFSKTILISGLIFLFSFSCVCDSFAQDTVVVQTLTFDDITKRRDIWQFPDDSESFRKILMYYRLKCDSRTTHDHFNCGEWDYLTYNTVYTHTGVYDSTLKEFPMYMVGRQAPDTIFYANAPSTMTNKRNKYSIVYDNVISEEEIVVGEGFKELTITPGYHRIQFLLDKKILKNMGLKSGNLDKIKFGINKASIELKDVTIRMSNTSLKFLNKITNKDLQEIFHLDSYNTDAGLNTFNLTNPFKWTTLSNLIVDFSFYTEDVSEEFSIIAYNDTSSLHVTGTDGYLYFDGMNDNVNCGDIDALDGISKFTFETWVRIDRWQAWNNIIGKEGKVLLQMGATEGQLYCIVRNPDNTHGNASYAINMNEWTHLAMVFDGTKTTNSEKLKLYVNGEKQTLTYNDSIPDTTPDYDGPFGITDVSANNSAMKGGIDEVRVWKTSLDGETIKSWMSKEIDYSHPDYSDLLAYYMLNEGEGYTATDNSGNGNDGKLIGIPEWRAIRPVEIVKRESIETKIPIIVLIQGEYESHIDTMITDVEVQRTPISIAKYKIRGNGIEIEDVTYAWPAGWLVNYDLSGNVLDTVFVQYDDFILNDVISYYEEPFEILDPYEIGRYITPYGINLDLGPDGFEWIYDVTDYAPLLQGEVDFAAGNQQELIDVRFEFIKGTPPRDVLNINRPWGARRSYSYRNLDDDTNLPATKVGLNKDAKQFKLRARLTGHGHNSNTGDPPHCCEWKDNIHYFNVNGEQIADWHIWRYNECGLNPVWPQGGTWNGRREGWCPGDIVFDYDFEITEYITSDSVTVDYAITPVPANNLGMGSGNYVTAIHLFEYADLNNEVDAEVYDVIAPSSRDYFSRINPICSNPWVVIRNNGREPLTSLKFTYSIDGGIEEIFNWSGDINSMKYDTINLPISGNEFWFGDSENKFTVTVSEPNGEVDMYEANDTYISDFTKPDIISGRIVLHYKTNLRPEYFTYRIKDVYGGVVFEKSDLGPSTLYIDSLYLQNGCYTLELLDAAHYGLSYWAYPAQGDGYFRIFNTTNQVIKDFDPDFGYGITYQFSIEDYPQLSIQGPNEVFTADTSVYSTPLVESAYNSWRIDGGISINSTNDDIKVIWGNPGTGYVTLIQHIPTIGYKDSIKKPINIKARQGTIVLSCDSSIQEYSAGDFLIMPVYLKGIDNLNITAVKADLRFNSSLLTPLMQTDTITMNAGETIISLTIPVEGMHGGLLSELSFRASLGNDTSTTLNWENVEVIGDPVNIETYNGRFSLAGVCMEGGFPRLISMDGQANLNIVKPNPTEGNLVIDYEIIEDGRTEIYIINSSGEKVKSIMNNVKTAGAYTVNSKISELSSGTYFIILKTPTIKKSVIVKLVK